MKREDTAMQKNAGLAKSAAIFAIVTALATMLAVWSPAPRKRSEAREGQRSGFKEFLCCAQHPGVGWAWRRKGVRQPKVGRPAAAALQLFRHEMNGWRTT